MVKPEWGTKRHCPKCNTRFYDLAKDDPVTCISCGFAWVPEPVLKSKQTQPFEAAKASGEATADAVVVDEDLELPEDVDAGEADADVDLGDDDDLGVPSEGSDEES
ncbi:MAG: TIGR02300 family protein [Sphingomonadales bacterium]